MQGASSGEHRETIDEEPACKRLCSPKHRTTDHSTCLEKSHMQQVGVLSDTGQHVQRSFHWALQGSPLQSAPTASHLSRPLRLRARVKDACAVPEPCYCDNDVPDQAHAQSSSGTWQDCPAERLDASEDLATDVGLGDEDTSTPEARQEFIEVSPLAQHLANSNLAASW